MANKPRSVDTITLAIHIVRLPLVFLWSLLAVGVLDSDDLAEARITKIVIETRTSPAFGAAQFPRHGRVLDGFCDYKANRLSRGGRVWRGHKPRGKDRRWDISTKRAEVVASLVEEHGYRVSEVAKFLRRDQTNISTMLSRFSARERR